MNYLKTSLWFLLASLVQAGVVWAAFQLGWTRFDAGLTVGRLLIHLGVGQLVGYLFLAWHKGRPEISGIGTGLVYGALFWGFFALLLGPAFGFIPSPLAVGTNATVFTLIAFLAYGLVVGAAADAIARGRLGRPAA